MVPLAEEERKFHHNLLSVLLQKKYLFSVAVEVRKKKYQFYRGDLL